MTSSLLELFVAVKKLTGPSLFNRITGMFLAVMLVFLVCWMPWWIMFITFSHWPHLADNYEEYGDPWDTYNLLSWIGVYAPTFWHDRRRCGRYPFRRSTANDVSGHYFHHYWHERSALRSVGVRRSTSNDYSGPLFSPLFSIPLPSSVPVGNCSCN